MPAVEHIPKAKPSIRSIHMFLSKSWIRTWAIWVKVFPEIRSGLTKPELQTKHVNNFNGLIDHSKASRRKIALCFLSSGKSTMCKGVSNKCTATIHKDDTRALIRHSRQAFENITKARRSFSSWLPDPKTLERWDMSTILTSSPIKTNPHACKSLSKLLLKQASMLKPRTQAQCISQSREASRSIPSKGWNLGWLSILAFGKLLKQMWWCFSRWICAQQGGQSWCRAAHHYLPRLMPHNGCKDHDLPKTLLSEKLFGAISRPPSP